MDVFSESRYYLGNFMKVFDVMGTPLTATTYDEFTKYSQELARAGETRAVDLSNTHVVTMRRHEPAFRALTSRFDFFLPDGMPLIWCLNRQGAALADRVYGPTFMRHCLLDTPAPFKHYFLGASADCLAQLQARLRWDQPELQVVGARHGYFREDQNDAIIEEINRLSPDFIWVGLGTPKQQQWIHDHKEKIQRGVIFAVGFAFDVNAGTKADAPYWMQRCGLTWLFRIASEPRRLLGRYLYYNTLFLYYLAKDAFSAKQEHQSA